MKFKSILAGIGLAWAYFGGTVQAGAMPLQEEKTLSTSAAARPAIDPDKEKAIRQLLDVTGAGRLAMQQMQQMVNTMRSSDTGIPEEFWTGFMKRIKPEELIDLIVPIYDKYLDKADVEGLIAFYQTPLGQKMLAKLPAIMQESTVAGEKWGRSKAEEVVREMEKQRSAPAKTTPAKPKTKSGKSKGQKQA